MVVDCSRVANMQLPLLETDFSTDPSILYDVRLEGLALDEVQVLPNASISRLSFHDNDIEDIDNGAFQYLLNLTEIDLSRNLLTFDSLGRDTFLGQFSAEEYLPLQVVVLNLGYNDLHSLNKDTFDHLPFLEVLQLNDNPIKIIDHQTAVAITTLRNLKVLNLSSTGISKIPDGLFHALPKLSALIMSNNKFTTVPQELENAKALEFLNFNNNPIIYFQRGDFKGLERLRELNISAMNELTSIEGEAFGSLRSLEVLRCSFNPNLSFIASDAFFGIANDKNEVKLREIHLRANALEHLSQYMLPWEKLNIVDIEENPWRCDCHLKWMINSLVGQINRNTPDLTLSLTCSWPEELKGQSLSTLSGDPSLSRCKMVFVGRGIDGSGRSSPSLLAVGILGIALCVFGTSTFLVILLRRNRMRNSLGRQQQVRYVRTRLDEAFSDRDGQNDYEPELYGDERNKGFPIA
ncbi:hypothetical protein QYM36_013311 [Artemia franciscana]|uniref:LRRCT domain-containing protein n=2 Tax=Artemia franciscana TaxID=6661 RepID=A0AA88HL18_ARTSF|nr:hypothetical protein QYM36_013311 [Artemia franciscana]